ncbi:MAG: ABC transporter ATP-binding protein [Peptococcaceae bacterium]|jgi:iron complex transport system ATP-binding protein|nr:ABC transporter ATP-binding protein [Peptococcaceae bacterium]MDH7526235.1 ABC transporter ATP-binding protein [Peptococcaceae bacterium]
MSLLELHNLSAGYQGTIVLKDISFAVESPEFVGIIGANGCGKTTLLKSISGYLKPRRGFVAIENKDIRQMSIRERAMTLGYVPQDIPYDFAFKCRDLVMMGRMPYLKRFQKESVIDRETVRESMEMTHTWHLRDRAATELSGGERQRVYIARALAQKPRVLLLDEPVSHLDLRFQVEILNLLTELSARGILVLVVLHDINLASQFCDEIIIMHEGAVLSRGKPAEVINNQNIESAFSINVQILDNPLVNTPYIVPSAAKKNIKLKVV